MTDRGAQFADVLAEFAEATHGIIQSLTADVLAVQEDHAKTREELYALTQRVEALEPRERKRV